MPRLMRCVVQLVGSTGTIRRYVADASSRLVRALITSLWMPAGTPVNRTAVLEPANMQYTLTFDLKIKSCAFLKSYIAQMIYIFSSIDKWEYCCLTVQGNSIQSTFNAGDVMRFVGVWPHHHAVIEDDGSVSHAAHYQRVSFCIQKRENTIEHTAQNPLL